MRDLIGESPSPSPVRKKSSSWSIDDAPPQPLPTVSDKRLSVATRAPMMSTRPRSSVTARRGVEIRSPCPLRPHERRTAHAPASSPASGGSSGSYRTSRVRTAHPRCRGVDAPARSRPCRSGHRAAQRQRAIAHRLQLHVRLGQLVHRALRASRTPRRATAPAHHARPASAPGSLPTACAASGGNFACSCCHARVHRGLPAEPRRFHALQLPRRRRHVAARQTRAHRRVDRIGGGDFGVRADRHRRRHRQRRRGGHAARRRRVRCNRLIFSRARNRRSIRCAR